MATVGRLEGAILRLHRGLYEASSGFVGHHMIGVPMLLLTTSGPRPANPRTAALVYARDGQDYVVVASNGGSDLAPAWFHNIEAQPEVEVRIARKTFAAKARVIDKLDPSYSRLWRTVNHVNHDRYEKYQARTARLIPLVRLTSSG